MPPQSIQDDIHSRLAVPNELESSDVQVGTQGFEDEFPVGMFATVKGDASWFGKFSYLWEVDTMNHVPS